MNDQYDGVEDEDDKNDDRSTKLQRKNSIENSLVAKFLKQHGFDRQVNSIHRLQTSFHGTRYGTGLAKVSLLGSGKIILVVLTILFWFLRPNLAWGPTRAASSVLSVVGVIKALFKGPRPYWISDKLHVLDPTLEVSFGFPSGHTAAVASTYGFIGMKEGYHGILLATIILIIVGISRVYTAAHFLHDVAGGAFIGLFTLSLLQIVETVPFSHKQLGLLSICFSISTLLVVISQYGTKRIPFKLVQEGLAGSGFLLGLGICHLLEEYVRISLSQKRGSLPMLACVLGLVGIIVLDRIVKYMTHNRKNKGHDVNLSIFGVIICCLLYASINVWALWLLPLIVDDFFLVQVLL